ncbi:hypothetical protein KAR91_53165 [Candidatus Pacearchaeota archaeon]|nr:hypothetical protein [Candidatus Pacearchaeota archaeon]
MSRQNDMIIISSNKRSSGTPQAGQYSVFLAGSVLGSYELLSFQSINNLTTVELGEDDVIYWIEGGTPLQATIPAGEYADQTAMNAAMKTAMDAVSASTFTFTINTDGTVSVSIAAGTFGWQFATNAGNNDSANLLLGVGQVDTPEAVTQDGTFVPSLRGATEGILIKIAEDNNQFVHTMAGDEFTFQIPIESNFGDNIDYVKRQSWQQVCRFSNQISNLNISLFNIDGGALPSTTPEWSMSIRRLF